MQLRSPFRTETDFVRVIILDKQPAVLTTGNLVHICVLSKCLAYLTTLYGAF